MLLHLLGPVARVKGFTSNAFFTEREVEDTASALLLFESGCQAVLNVSHACHESRDRFELHGSDGLVRIPVLNEGILHVKTKQGERVEKHPPHTNFHQPLIENFALAVIEGRNPAVDGLTGREVNRILAEVYGS
jgi:predicted dehydrogenase